MFHRRCREARLHPADRERRHPGAALRWARRHAHQAAGARHHRRVQRLGAFTRCAWTSHRVCLGSQRQSGYFRVGRGRRHAARSARAQFDRERRGSVPDAGIRATCASPPIAPAGRAATISTSTTRWRGAFVASLPAAIQSPQDERHPALSQTAAVIVFQSQPRRRQRPLGSVELAVVGQFRRPGARGIQRAATTSSPRCCIRDAQRRVAPARATGALHNCYNDGAFEPPALGESGNEFPEPAAMNPRPHEGVVRSSSMAQAELSLERRERIGSGTRKKSWPDFDTAVVDRNGPRTMQAKSFAGKSRTKK